MSSNLYVIAAPSGAGKTSLVEQLVQTMPNMKISISHTTRLPRPREINGKEYFFIDEHEFKKMIDAQKFLEHAIVFGHHYGTSRDWVVQQLELGVDVILEIDWQGSRQICQLFPYAISIFILPPSMHALAERLNRRNQDKPDVIQQRLVAAEEEIQHSHEFDYLIINDDFNLALADLCHIICANRLKTVNQQRKLSNLLDELIGSSTK